MDSYDTIILMEIIISVILIMVILSDEVKTAEEQNEQQQIELRLLEQDNRLYKNYTTALKTCNERLYANNQLLKEDMKSLEKELKHKDSEIFNYKEEIRYFQDVNKPIPLQIAENIHKESTYLLNGWDCSDKVNEWVRRMRQQGYYTNYTTGMIKTENGSYEYHAWGLYLQPIEITYPRFIEAKEIGINYIHQPSRIDIDCEVC